MTRKTQYAGYSQITRILIISFITGIGIMYSCKNREGKPSSPYANDLGIKPSTVAQIDTAHYTTIKWMDPVKHFGTIRYGDSVLIKFRFRNTGIHPLFLSEVRTSCGCTVPKYPENAIMPEEENEMIVNFHSIGQADSIYKTILVTSNTSNGVKHLLTIEGIVEKAAVLRETNPAAKR